MKGVLLLLLYTSSILAIVLYASRWVVGTGGDCD
jgi:hypothetical protein